MKRRGFPPTLGLKSNSLHCQVAPHAQASSFLPALHDLITKRSHPATMIPNTSGPLVARNLSDFCGLWLFTDAAGSFEGPRDFGCSPKPKMILRARYWSFGSLVSATSCGWQVSFSCHAAASGYYSAHSCCLMLQSMWVSCYFFYCEDWLVLYQNLLVQPGLFYKTVAVDRWWRLSFTCHLITRYGALRTPCR